MANIYKELLNDQEQGGDEYYITSLKESFNPETGVKSTYMLSISDKNKTISISVNGEHADIKFGENKEADVVAKLTKEVFDQIVDGTVTFHRAFMTGAMTARGNLKTLRMLDEIFKFPN